MKKQHEVEALKVLNRVYRDGEKAQSQLSAIRSAVMSGKAENFKQTLKYVMRWRILQRCEL